MNDRQQRAYNACVELMQLGLSQKEIAARIEVHAATINRICNLDRADEWRVGEETVLALEALVMIVREEKSVIALAELPIKLLDTCNDAGVIVDDQISTEICQACVMSLAHAINQKVHIPLPNGIEGAVASVGPDLYIVKLQRQTGDTNEVEIKRRHLLIHELEHLIQRLRADLPEQEESSHTISAY